MKKYLAFLMTFIMVIPNSFCVFAAEESSIDLSNEEAIDAADDPVEITEFEIDGYKSIYDKEIGMYTFEPIEENETKNNEKVFRIDPENISTEVQYSDEAIIVESGMEQDSIQGIENDDVMVAASSLPDLYVYDLKATTDLIVGQEQNRFSYKVANLGGSIAQNVEVAFVVDNAVAGTYNLGDIGASQAVGGYFVLGKISQSGTHGVGVYADYRNLIEESNETNNSMGKYFTWFEASNYKPDLTVELEYPLASNIAGSKNDSDTRGFQFKISNIGPVATSEDGFTMAIYIDNKKIGNMQIPQMNGMVEQSGRFNLAINAYLPFTLELVVDDLDEVEESNEKNNSDEIEYNPTYCRHFSTVITSQYIPFPDGNIKLQLATTAFQAPFSQAIFANYLGKWNGITEKCNIDSSVSVSDDVLDSTNIFIFGYSDPYDAANGATWRGDDRTDGIKYVRIGLNANALANASESEIGRTIIHELGHVFGMDHPKEDDVYCGYVSIMVPYNGTASLKSYEIKAHDKYALCMRYDELSRSLQTIEETIPTTESSIYRERTLKVDSEKVLDETSEYIVKGHFIGERENVEEDYIGYTLSDFMVDKVYKGDDLEQGSIIKIREPYYTQCLEDGSGITYRFEDYASSINGEEYIFFLLKRDDIYGLPNSTLSRYPLNDNISVTFPYSNDFSFTEENYETLRNEVLNKYK